MTESVQKTSELQATPEIEVSGQTFYRIHQKREPQETDPKIIAKTNAGKFKSLVRDIIGRRAMRNKDIECLLDDYEAKLEYRARYRNPEDLWAAKQYAESQGLELLTAKDFASMLKVEFVGEFGDKDNPHRKEITDDQKNIFFENFHLFTEAAIYHPEKKQVLLVRNSPILQNEETYRRMIAMQDKKRNRYREILGTLILNSSEEYKRLLEEGEFFLTEEEYKSYAEQAKADSEKLPWNRQVQILSTDIEGTKTHVFYPRTVLNCKNLETANFYYHEATQFLFGEHKRMDLARFIETPKHSSPLGLHHSIGTYASDSIDRVSFSVIDSMAVQISTKEHPFSTEKLPYVDKPFARQIGFTAYSGLGYPVIMVNAYLPEDNPVRAVKKK